MVCRTLAAIQRKVVSFNPHNPDHLNAARTLCLGVPAGHEMVLKQHPTLRFELEAPFTDVRTMMIHKVLESHMSNMGVVA